MNLEPHQIDTNFNFQAEMGGYEAKDADGHSRTLQEYHRLLWSKPLPDGTIFELEKLKPACLLRFNSPDGEMRLSSDRAVATYIHNNKIPRIIAQIPQEELDAFNQVTETIGGIIIWPSRRVDGKSTINGARGFDRRIDDRLDLTIECIRRYYNDEVSPLYETFKRYGSFFSLFRDFQGYINFFLFQDFVSEDYKSTHKALPFDNFVSSGVPKTVEEYKNYMQKTTQLVTARNRRIAAYASGLSNQVVS